MKVKGYNSRELIKIANSNGWVLARVNGDDHHFKHSDKGFITIPHPKQNYPRATLGRILKKIESR
jgi:predicted RNA binding protein YcfA (HicA-like mRNA interferase family)